MYTKEFAINSPLSPREKEVCRLCLRLPNRKYIADAMGISNNTVGDHFKIIFLKLGIHNRFELMNLLHEHPSLLD